MYIYLYNYDNHWMRIVYEGEGEGEMMMRSYTRKYSVCARVHVRVQACVRARVCVRKRVCVCVCEPITLNKQLYKGLKQ